MQRLIRGSTIFDQPVKEHQRGLSIYFCGALMALMLVFAPFNSEWTFYWAFVSDLEGQYWRLLTAHLSHWSWMHWALNISGLLFFAYIYGQAIKVVDLVLCLLWMLLACTVMLEYFYARDFYLGFSSLLYGLFCYAALLFWRRQLFISAMILIFLVGRTIYLWLLPEDDSGVLIGLPVAYEVHASAIIGAIFSWCFGRLVRWANS